jgi:hypothetical protein
MRLSETFHRSALLDQLVTFQREQICADRIVREGQISSQLVNGLISGPKLQDDLPSGTLKKFAVKPRFSHFRILNYIILRI